MVPIVCVPSHVEMALQPEGDTVILPSQAMEENTVKEQTRKANPAIRILVQVR